MLNLNPENIENYKENDPKKYVNIIGWYIEKYIFIGTFWLEIINRTNTNLKIYIWKKGEAEKKFKS